MVATIARKPKTEKRVNILERQDFGNGHILYTVLSSNGVDKHWTTLVNNHATGCTCRELPSGHVSKYACYHMHGCEQNEATRASDLVAHIEDSNLIVSKAAVPTVVIPNTPFAKVWDGSREWTVRLCELAEQYPNHVVVSFSEYEEALIPTCNTCSNRVKKLGDYCFGCLS